MAANQELIDVVARMIFKSHDPNCASPWDTDDKTHLYYYLYCATEIVEAIEAAGYRVVPVVPTEKMKDALASHLFHVEPEPTYAAMLAAAPSVLSD